MSLIFQNAFLLPLLAAVAVPLVVHLVAKPRPPVRPFPAVDFILRALRRRHRVRRPQNWLLLMLRTVAVLLLVLLFLRPLLFRAGGRRREGRTTVVLLVDASASMGVVDGAQSRFSAACAEASKVLGGLRAGDWANLSWLAAVPSSEYPEPGPNHDHLRHVLARAMPTAEATDPAAGLAAAAEQLASVEGSKEIVVISDFQQTGWRDIRPTLPADIQLTAIQVGTGRSDNVAVTRLSAVPRQPFVGEDAVLTATVTNYSDRRRVATAYLEAGSFRESREVALDPWATVDVAFTVPTRQAGEIVLQVGLSEDAFPLDNDRALVLNVVPALTVSLVSASEETGPIWHRALRAFDWVRLRERPASELGVVPSVSAAVVDAGGATEAARALALADRGGLVLWALGRATESLDPGIAGVEGASSLPVAWELCRGAESGLRFAAEAEGFMKAVAGANDGFLAPILVQQRAAVTAAAEIPGALVRFADGRPALWARRYGQGTVILWALALPATGSNISRRPEFLPLLGELLLQHRPTGTGAPTTAAVCPGMPVPSPAAGPADDPIRLRALDTSGAELARAAGPGGTAAGPWMADRPGLVQWCRGDDVIAVSVVNLDPAESDLRSVSESELEDAWRVPAGLGGGQMRALREGEPLWPWLLTILCAVLLVESLLTVWSEGASLRPLDRVAP